MHTLLILESDLLSPLLNVHCVFIGTIDKLTCSRSLRLRAHNFELPPKDNKNFLSRVPSALLWVTPRCR